ncbi:hypothetical protein D3C79_635180 [compost metagenome]
MAGADKALGQLVGQVLGLQRHLPGHVQRHGVGAVLVDDAAQARSGGGDGLVDAGTRWLLAALLAHIGILHAPGGGQRQVCGEAFGAQAAEVAGVLLVAADLADLAIGDAHDDAATDAAVGADAAHFAVGHGRAPVGNAKRRRLPLLAGQAGQHGAFVVKFCGLSTLIALGSGRSAINGPAVPASSRVNPLPQGYRKA